jgi:uroporphyrinogen-III decarboxylase
MERLYYLDLARFGLRMPIGADLVLKEHDDHEAIVVEGARLGRVIEQAARRYRTPIAIPLMDLDVERELMLSRLDVPEKAIPTHQFRECPTDEMVEALVRRHDRLTLRVQANADAVRYIAEKTDLLPVGMCIGPFSLMTKLLADPITPVYLAGTGLTTDEDADVRTMERVLDMAIHTILQAVAAQAEAGAKALMVAEPAANRIFVSPKQIDAGSDIFERTVVKYNRMLRDYLGQRGVDLLFHCCGELTDYMVAQFARLEPAMLSLGSSRTLWEDAALVPKDIVLYGNLPSKQFYSDALVTRADVVRLACEMIERMRGIGHPFVLGSECDVLSVPGCEETIKQKCRAFVECECEAAADT